VEHIIPPPSSLLVTLGNKKKSLASFVFCFVSRKNDFFEICQTFYQISHTFQIQAERGGKRISINPGLFFNINNYTYFCSTE